MPAKPRHFRIGLFLLILAAAGLYLLGNGRVALWDRDEPRYAMASRWMLKSGDWVVPHIGVGDESANAATAKPPLVYWCQATAMKIFGPTVFAARFPSSVAMILTLSVLAGVLGKYFPQHAFWTLLIFATSVLTIIAAKMCVIDSVQLLWITISQLCLYAFWQRRSHLPTLFTFGLALGLAGLAKGPVAWGVLATTLIILWLLGLTLKKTVKRPGISFSPYIAVALIALVIIIPWLILVEHRSPGFLGRIVGHDLIQRMHEPLEGHKGPPGFYLLTIFGTFYPWSLFLPLTIANAWRHRDEPAIRFAFAAVIGPWIIFECVSTKMVHYLLPVFPPLAFLLADAIVRILNEMQNENQMPSINSVFSFLPRWAICIWAIITTAIATALLLPDRWFVETPLWPGIVMVVAGLIYAISVLSLFWNGKLHCAPDSNGFGICRICGVIVFVLFTEGEFLAYLAERRCDPECQSCY